MKTRNIISGLIVAGLSAGMMMPQPAAGRQKDWATAGKILAGVVIGSALHQAVHTTPSRHSTVVVHAPPSQHRHPGSSRTGIHHSRSSMTYSRGRPSSTRTYRPATCRTARVHPIIVDAGCGRRLYQPPVRGHQALVQRRCRRSGSWITIGTHPSIW